MIFGKNKTTPSFHIALAYLQHSPETKQILVYNTGKSTLKEVQVKLINDQGNSSIYTFATIASRSNEVIDIKTKIDINEKLFSGEIGKVEIEIYNEKIIFIPKPDGKFLIL